MRDKDLRKVRYDDGLPARLKYLREHKTRPIRSMDVTSELCGLSHSAFRRYERGEAKPGYDAIKAIADYFDVSVDWLMGLTDRMN